MSLSQKVSFSKPPLPPQSPQCRWELPPVCQNAGRPRRGPQPASTSLPAAVHFFPEARTASASAHRPSLSAPLLLLLPLLVLTAALLPRALLPRALRAPELLPQGRRRQSEQEARGLRRRHRTGSHRGAAVHRRALCHRRYAGEEALLCPAAEPTVDLRQTPAQPAELPPADARPPSLPRTPAGLVRPVGELQRFGAILERQSARQPCQR